MSIISRTGTANSAIADERRKSLRSLSHEDAWRIYRDLCYTWEQNPNKQGMKHLERKRIQHLLEFREKLDQIGGRDRNGHTT